MIYDTDLCPPFVRVLSDGQRMSSSVGVDIGGDVGCLWAIFETGSDGVNRNWFCGLRHDGGEAEECRISGLGPVWLISQNALHAMNPFSAMSHCHSASPPMLPQVTSSKIRALLADMCRGHE